MKDSQKLEKLFTARRHCVKSKREKTTLSYQKTKEEERKKFIVCLYFKPLSAFQAWWDMLGNFLVYVSLSSQNMFCVFSTASTLPPTAFRLLYFHVFFIIFSTAIRELSFRRKSKKKKVFQVWACWRERKKKWKEGSRKWRVFCESPLNLMYLHSPFEVPKPSRYQIIPLLQQQLLNFVCV